MLSGRRRKAASSSWKAWRKRRETFYLFLTTCWRTERCNWKMDASWCRRSVMTSCCRSALRAFTVFFFFFFHDKTDPICSTSKVKPICVVLDLAIPIFDVSHPWFDFDDAVWQEHTKEELDSWKIIRVSEDFRVIALGLPVPKYKGNPLDPPLRSRFQARDIYNLPFRVSPSSCTLLRPARDGSIQLFHVQYQYCRYCKSCAPQPFMYQGPFGRYHR